MKETSDKSFKKDNSKKNPNDSEKKDSFQKELETTKKELKAIHSRFNSLFEKTNDAIVIMDLETQRYVMANQKAADLFGFDLKNTEKLSAYSFVSEDEREKSTDSLVELRKGKILPIYVRKFSKSSGEIFYGEVNLSLVEDPISKRTLIQSIIRDITKRKEAEETLERDRLIFQKIANAAIQTTDVPEFCNRVLNDLLGYLDFDIGTLRIYDQETELLTPLAVLGLQPERISDLRPMKLTDEQYIISQAIINKKPLFAPDVSKTPELKKYKSRLELFEIQALISWPILDKNKNVLGAFQLSAKKPKIIPEEDKTLFESIAIMLANALERFNAEKALERAFHEREELDKVIEMSPAIIFLWRNAPGWPVDFVTNNVHILGYTPMDFYTEKISYKDLILEEDSRLERLDVDLYSQKEYPYEFPIDYRIKTKSGEIKWVMEFSTPRKDINGEITHYHGLILDITERKEQEESLKEAYNERKELDTIINLSPAIVFLWRNAEGWPVEYVSDNIEIFGYTPEDFYSGVVPYSNIVFPEDLERIANEVNVYSKDKKRSIFTQEYRIVTKAGEVHWIYDYTTIRRDEKGKITHYHGIILDITDRKKAEDSLRSERKAFQITADAAAVATTLPELCQIILNGLIDTLDFDIGSIRLYNDKNKLLEPVANVRVESSNGRMIQPISIDNPEYINALVARTKIAIFAPDISTYEIAQIYIENLKKIKVKSIITWPLLNNEGDLLGILQLAAHKPKEIPEEDRVVFETITGTIRNAIERLIADDAKRESEERYRSTVETLLDGITLIENNEIVYANERALEIYGYTKDEYMSIPGFQLMVPDNEKEKYSNVVQDMLKKQGQTAEMDLWITRKDGTRRYVRNKVYVKYIDNKPGDMYIATSDLTNGKIAEDSLIRERLFFKLVAEIALFSKNITELNEKMVKSLMDIYEFDMGSIRLFDETTNQLILSAEFGLRDLIGKEPQPIDIGAKGSLIGKVAPDKKLLFIPDVNDYDLEEDLLDLVKNLKIRGFVAFPIISDNDELIGTLSLASYNTKEVVKDDVIFFESVIRLLATAIRKTQAEEELRKLNEELEFRVQQRTTQLVSVNKELEAFSYSVSHDLRTPLRSIDGFSQALLEDYSDQLDETGKDYLTRVRSASTRMSVLIDDILSLSRLTRKDMDLREINLSELVKNILSDFQESEPDRKVKVKVEKNIKISGDSALIRTIMENLLGNAWKFTSKKPKARIDFGKKIINNEEVYFVQDDGVGFDRTYKDKLFAVFQRLHTYTEFKGTGIGLAIVQRIVSRHGGRVWAESELGKGATFYFTLPAQQTDEEVKM